MTGSGALERGRAAFSRRTWAAAYAELAAADADRPLDPDDLERLAVAAYLVGRDAESADASARAYQELVAAGELCRAALCGYHQGMGFARRGEMAQAGGWFARAERLLDEGGVDCVARGYLLVPGALRSLNAGDPADAYQRFGRVAEVADRFGDPDLIALGRLGQGTSLVVLGRTAEGLALLDELMVAVTASELSAVTVGIVYCTAIVACQEIFDLQRAREWTLALTRWCEPQPDLVPYRGQCLVHRAEIMQLRGEWPDALDEATRACEQLARDPAVGMAFYALGELRRLRGELDAAEDAYRRAGQAGRDPQPGLALLRLAQGRAGDAYATIRRVLDEARERAKRALVLAAYVEIALANDDVPAARSAVDDLAALAAGLDAPPLHAVVARANGHVLLAEDDPRAALADLRTAWRSWREIEAPYEAARTRVLIGLCCRRLGDRDGAEMELDAARWIFRELGAGPDLARVEHLVEPAAADRTAGGLTAREVEVLRLVATGKTNRAIAGELFLSEKTIARHVANVCTKLGVSTRTAATAYAYEHGLVGRSG